MKTTTRWILTSTAMCFLIASYGQVIALAQDVPEWADEWLGEWYEATNAGNAEAVAKMYSNDADFNSYTGREKHLAEITKLFSGRTFSCTGAFDGLVQVGHTAVGWGSDSCIVIGKETGETIIRRSNWLATYERSNDGTWLCVRDVFEVPGS